MGGISVEGDGLWGTITFLWEIIKLPYTLTKFAWNVVSSLGDVNIGAVLQSIANGASGVANWIGNNGRAILTEIKEKALSGDVGNLADTLQGMYRSVTGFVQRGGARLAEKMLEFFGQRSDRLGATLGNVAGTVAGNVTFEVATTVLTAGGAQGLLRLRGPVGAALRWMAATGRRALDVAGDVYRTVRGLYTSLKSSVLAYLGRFSGMLRTKLDEMIEGVMRFFENLMVRVRRGPRAADDAADATGDGRRAAGAAEDARQPGARDRTPDAERAEAVAIAKGITAANEKAGTPAAALDGILTGALKPRFGWIQGFDTTMFAPGHYRIIMRTPIDDDYFEGELTAEAIALSARLFEDGVPIAREEAVELTIDVATILAAHPPLLRNKGFTGHIGNFLGLMHRSLSKHGVLLSDPEKKLLAALREGMAQLQTRSPDRAAIYASIREALRNVR